MRKESRELRDGAMVWGTLCLSYVTLPWNANASYCGDWSRVTKIVDWSRPAAGVVWQRSVSEADQTGGAAIAANSTAVRRTIKGETRASHAVTFRIRIVFECCILACTGTPVGLVTVCARTIIVVVGGL